MTEFQKMKIAIIMLIVIFGIAFFHMVSLIDSCSRQL